MLSVGPAPKVNTSLMAEDAPVDGSVKVTVWLPSWNAGVLMMI